MFGHRFVRRPVKVLACAIMALLALTLGTSSAQADQTVPGRPGLGGERAAAAVTHDPTTSPAPRSSGYISGPLSAPLALSQCPRGYGCAFVQAPGSNRYKVFRFYNYGAYYLSYFLNRGLVVNNQTGNAKVRITTLNGSYKDIPPQNQLYGAEDVTWDPYYKITLLAP